MPSRWEITLPGVDAAGVRLEWVHAAVSGWFDDGEAGHRVQVKPYAVSPPFASDRGAAISIGLIDDALADRLPTRAASGVTVRLGSVATRLNGPPRQVAASTWAQLGEPTSAEAWCLRFVSPTTFRRGNAFAPSPAPAAILGSLRRSWATFGPEPVLLELSPDPVWLTDIDVTSQVVRVAGRTVSGFTGRLRFACDAGPEAARAVNTLVGLAPYAGVGAHTTSGFGVTALESTWQPRTRPRPRPPAPGRIPASSVHG
jgi:CRISPR-associated endoribonuclease Cas6